MVRVLLAEDDEGIRAMTGSLLRQPGYTVDFACDGLEAIDRLRANDYDAVILDLMMPTASGFEVLAWLHREKRGYAREHVIVLTAMGQEGLSNLTEQRVFAVMRKPFDIDDLRKTVARCAGSPGT